MLSERVYLRAGRLSVGHFQSRICCSALVGMGNAAGVDEQNILIIFDRRQVCMTENDDRCAERMGIFVQAEKFGFDVLTMTVHDQDSLLAPFMQLFRRTVNPTEVTIAADRIHAAPGFGFEIGGIAAAVPGVYDEVKVCLLLQQQGQTAESVVGVTDDKDFHNIVRSCSANFCKATARWLRAFFSTMVAWAKVLPSCGEKNSGS